MRFNTVLKAMLIQYGYIWMGLPTPLRVRQYRKFSDWLLRHEEKQAAEIARLQAQVATLTNFIHANIETFEDQEF